MEKHEYEGCFVPAIGSGCRVCYEGGSGLRLKSDPIHVPAQPERKVGCENDDGTLNIHPESETCEVCRQPATEPERMSDEWLDEMFENHRGCAPGDCSLNEEISSADAMNLIRELRTLRAQLAEKEQYAVNAKAALEAEFANHIKTRTQLAEKDAAIEKARQDALEEAELRINALLHTEAISRARAEKNGRKLVSECRTAGVECYQAAIAEIRALAAEKKEG